MSSYNRVNGQQAAESPYLLSTLLRKEWGYEGLVVSDWSGVKDRVQALQAGMNWQCRSIRFITGSCTRRP